MIVVILKNTLLILLIVLITHFMIKNRIMDDIDNFKRKLVHDDTLNELHNSSGANKQIASVVEEERNLVSSHHLGAKKKPVRFDDSEYVPECPNGLTCDDFKVTDESLGMMASKEENSMKELYDFVYDEVSKEDSRIPKEEKNLNPLQNTEASRQSMHDFFPEGQTFETKVDKTEIDAHYSSKSMEMVPNSCNFEVVGMIEVDGGGDEGSVFGLDTLSSTNFSTIL